MPMTMIKVEVTQADIDKGDRRNPCGCPIALAIARVFPASHPYCNADGVEFSPAGDRTDIPLPDEVVAWMDRYDAGLVVEPFTFELPSE